MSCHNVHNVTAADLKLCNKRANKLPSVSTIQDWSTERAIIARRQIADSCDNADITLYTDEASKCVCVWGGGMDCYSRYIRKLPACGIKGHDHKIFQ